MLFINISQAPPRACYAPATVPLVLLNKPFNVLSQFRDDGGRDTLAKFVAIKSVYPAGRLDYDSEGLILLSDDGQLQARISGPKYGIEKSYWAQIEGTADPSAIDQLKTGVLLKDGIAKTSFVSAIAQPDALWSRNPPIRERKKIPVSWLDITITEGRNRQVRRMTAAAGRPTLRLIRHRIGPWSIKGLLPGESREIDNKDAWHSLNRYLEDLKRAD